MSLSTGIYEYKGVEIEIVRKESPTTWKFEGYIVTSAGVLNGAKGRTEKEALERTKKLLKASGGRKRRIPEKAKAAKARVMKVELAKKKRVAKGAAATRVVRRGVKNPALKKARMAAVTKEFKELVRKASEKYPKVVETKLVANAQIHKTPRAYGMAGIEKAGPIVQIAPELALCAPTEIRGVLEHELGHIIVLLGYFKMVPGHDAMQRQADKVAEKVFGNKIYYNKNSVQAAGRGARGARPRPKGLK